MVHRGAAHSAESGVGQVDDGLQGHRVQSDQVHLDQGSLLPGQGRQRVRGRRAVDAGYDEEEGR